MGRRGGKIAGLGNFSFNLEISEWHIGESQSLVFVSFLESRISELFAVKSPIFLSKVSASLGFTIHHPFIKSNGSIHKFLPCDNINFIQFVLPLNIFFYFINPVKKYNELIVLGARLN